MNSFPSTEEKCFIPNPQSRTSGPVQVSAGFRKCEARLCNVRFYTSLAQHATCEAVLSGWEIPSAASDLMRG